MVDSHTIAEGKRLGLQIDKNNGTGWPFGGPEVTAAQSARKRVAESWTVSPGKKLKITVRPSDRKQQGVATLQRIIAVNGDRRIDITSHLRRDSLLLSTRDIDTAQYHRPLRRGRHP